MTTMDCNRCGACCWVLPISNKHLSPEYKQYLITRGVKEDIAQGFMLIPHKCQHLITEGNIRSCDIYNSPDRPYVCRIFTGQKHIKGSQTYIPLGCSYRRE